MFTGIIEIVASVTSAKLEANSLRVRIATEFADLALGESIAVNGVCLTVAEFDEKGEALFFISPETLAKTHLQNLKPGSAVNLERAVSLETRLSGHLVQGHVDGMGELVSIETIGESVEMKIRIPAPLSRYCVEKGSIAVNGVSLTINSISEPEISINPQTGLGTLISFMLIPHTWKHTQFSTLALHDFVNIEVDVMAKYVERLCHPYLTRSMS